MEMNVSNAEQVVARKTGGLNPFLVLPLLLVVGVSIYLLVFGNTSFFTHKGEPISGLSVAFSGIPAKDLTPTSIVGMIYLGGFIVPILVTFAITVLVFSLERSFVLNKAEGAGNLEVFVLKIRQLLKENKIQLKKIPITKKMAVEVFSSEKFSAEDSKIEKTVFQEEEK